MLAIGNRCGTCIVRENDARESARRRAEEQEQQEQEDGEE
jgi:hypothetical protein